MNALYMKARALSKKSKKIYKKIRHKLGLHIKQVSKKPGDSCHFHGTVKREEPNVFWIESVDGSKAIYFVDNFELKKVTTGKAVSIAYSEFHYEFENQDTKVFWNETKTFGEIYDDEGFHIASLNGMKTNEIRTVEPEKEEKDE